MNLGYYQDNTLSTEHLIPLVNERRFAHTQLIGNRAGKTTALQNYVLNDIESGEGLLFIDVQGKAIDEILERIPPERANDITFLDFGDTKHPPALNLFYDIPQERHGAVSSTLVEMAHSIWDYGRSITPRLDLYLRAAARVMLCVPNGTLLGIYYLITSWKHRDLYLAHVKDSIVKGHWESFDEMKPQEQTTNTDSTLTRIFELISDPVMRNIIGQYRSSIDLKEIMSGRKVLLVSAPESVLGRDLSRMLGHIILCLVQLAAMERNDDTPFHVYLDNADRFAGSHLAQMLDSIGDYGVSLTLAYRYLGQFDPPFKQALLGSVGTLVCFQLGPQDADDIKPMLKMGQNHLYDTLTDIPPYHAYVNTPGWARLITMPALTEEVNTKRAKAIRARCRSQYTGRKEQVERGIAAFIAEA